MRTWEGLEKVQITLNKFYIHQKGEMIREKYNKGVNNKRIRINKNRERKIENKEQEQRTNAAGSED